VSVDLRFYFSPLVAAIDYLIVIISIRSNEEAAISYTKASSGVTSPLSTSEG